MLINLVFFQISSSIWYRLSILLNFLPTEMDLKKIGELIVCLVFVTCKFYSTLDMVVCWLEQIPCQVVLIIS